MIVGFIRLCCYLRSKVFAIRLNGKNGETYYVFAIRLNEKPEKT